MKLESGALILGAGAAWNGGGLTVRGTGDDIGAATLTRDPRDDGRALLWVRGAAVGFVGTFTPETEQ